MYSDSTHISSPVSLEGPSWTHAAKKMRSNGLDFVNYGPYIAN